MAQKYADSWDSRGQLLTESVTPEEADMALALRYLQRMKAEDVAPCLGLTA